jgi:dTDP-4-dehydrorhamnose 3,5-epimerase
MIVSDTKVPDVKIIEPTVFRDERGFLLESYNQKNFEDAIGYSVSFVQDNHSKSRKGVLRGLHYQLPPYAQDKLIRVVRGEVFDVAVDIRKSSSTFKQWVALKLNEHQRRQIWIPKGFAHGFIVLSDFAEIIYKTTEYYEPTHERTILWSDPEISIQWPVPSKPILSNKDQAGLLFKELEIFD